jgi:hypothetical protein
LLQLLVDKADGDGKGPKFNSKSKAGDFIHYLEQNTTDFSKDALNAFLQYEPAGQIAFAKSISRINKVSTIASWITSIFENNQQMTLNSLLQKNSRLPK